MALPVFDNATTYFFNDISDSRSFTTAGSDRLLLVMTVNRNAGGGTITGVTYNGVAMSQVGSMVEFFGANWEYRLWALVAPASGANALAIALDGAREVCAVVMSFNAVDQGAPYGTREDDGAADATADQILASFFGETDHGSAGLSFTSTGTGQTERTEGGAPRVWGTGATQNGPGTPVTASFSVAGESAVTSFGTFVLPINGITAGGGSNANLLSGKFGALLRGKI